MIDACKKHGKYPGMGGIYDEEWARLYVGWGCKFILGGSDGMFISQSATARATFLKSLG